MANFAALEQKKQELIRKAVGGSLFIAPITAPVIATLTSADKSLATLPVGTVTAVDKYSDGGLMTREGLRFARSIELSEVQSWGRASATRSDVSTDDETVQVDFQETSKQTIALFTGADPASLVPGTNGELKIDKPTTPAPRFYRLLSLAVDGPPEAEIYIGKHMPRAKVTDYEGQVFAQGDDAIQWGVTFTAQVDSTVGTSVRYLFGGPGWYALLAAMGFPAGA